MTDFRTIRDRLGLTQAAAARAFNVTLQTWQNWEAGRKPAGPAVVLAEHMMAQMLENVARLADRDVAEHGDAWQRVGLYRSSDGEYFIAGQGGPASEWGREHGAIVFRRIPVDADEAHRLAPGMIP